MSNNIKIIQFNNNYKNNNLLNNKTLDNEIINKNNNNEITIIDNNNKNNNNNNNNNNKNNNNNFNLNSEKNNSINFFEENNDELVIVENVALGEYEKEYKNDTVYLQELENQLLSTYPVTKQNEKYIIERVQRRSETLIDVKNIGVNKNNLIKSNIEYDKKNDLLNHDFSSTWVIPVVSDNHIIFTNILNKKNENENNNLQETKKILTELKEDPEGYTEINQKDFLLKLNENNKKFENKEISIFDYEKNNAELYSSFKIKFQNDQKIQKSGFLIQPKESFNVLRINDINNTNWNIHKNLNNLYTSTNIYDDDGKIKGVKDDILVKGNGINVSGFLVLREGGHHILDDYKDILIKENYSDHLYHVLYNKSTINTIKLKLTDSKTIIIELEDIHFNQNDIIFINQSNCYPNIDGYYDSNKFKIINEHKKIEIKINKPLLFQGNKGFIYKLSSLKYDLYDTNQNLNFDFLYSSYESQNEDKNHNKLYLFNKIDNLNKNKINTILKKIIPSLDEIIDLELEHLKECQSIYDVNKILSKYYLNIYDLHKKQFDIIHKLLLKKYNKIKEEFSLEPKFNHANIKYFYNNLDFLKNNNYYLNNDHLLDNEIIKYYGYYPYLNTSFDNIFERFKWVKNQIDNGLLYFYILSLKYNESYKIKNQYVENKIKKLQEQIKLIEKNYLKEKPSENKCTIYKFEGYKIEINDIKDINNLNILKLKHTFNSYLKNHDYLLILFENKLLKFDGKKLEEDIEIKNEDLLLISNKISFNYISNDFVISDLNEIYEYDKNKWILLDKTPHYKKLKYLCEFKDVKLSNLNLDDLDCVYQKNYGCSSKSFIRYKTKLNDLNKNLDKYNELLNNLKNNHKEKEIKQKIKQDIIKFNFNYKNKNNKIKRKNDNVTKTYISDQPIDILVYKINKLKNILLKEYYFYQIIDLDGLLIDKDLYSKKYKTKYNFCGHYYYKKKIYYADNVESRNRSIQLLINEYSNAGQDDRESYICQHCGETLLNNDYDEVEGRTSSGAFVISRDTWVENESFNLSKMDINEYLEKIEQLDCNDEKFKEILLNNGLNFRDIEKAKSVCQFVTNTLYPKLGIQLPNGDLIQLIIDVIQKINLIMSYKYYKNKEIAKFLKSGKSQALINKMEQKNIFKNYYDIYYQIKKQTIITARLLITIQVIIPNLKSTKKVTHFNEKEGIFYFSELLKEINKKTIIDKEDVLGMYYDYIKNSYDEFKEMVVIKQAFKDKQKYLQIIKKDKLYKFDIEEIQSIHFNSVPQSIDIDKINIKKLDYNKFLKLYNSIYLRDVYISQQINKTINTIVAKKSLEIVDLTSGLIEGSCCSQSIDNYIDFYQYFEIIDNNSNIYQYIDESKKLNQLLNIKYNSGCFHRFILFNKDWIIGNNNPIIVYDGVHASEKLIKSLFLHYVDEGPYIGTLRDYIQEIDQMKDIKTDKTYQEIYTKKYNIDDFNTLLKKIEEKNIKIIKHDKNESKIKEEIEFQDKLKKEALNKKYVQINNLLKSLSNILSKNNNYIDKFINIINNFGVLSLDKKLENKNEKQKRNILNSVDNENADYFRKFYIKIKKYLSIIQHNLDFNDDPKLNIIEKKDSQIKNEIKTLIIEENSKLQPFLEKNVNKHFKNIELKYSIDEIQQLYGKSNILSKNNKVLKYSSFNESEASGTLMFIVFEQLNDMLNQTNNNIYIAQFIDVLMNELEEDFELFEICNMNNEFESLDARFYNAYQLKIMTSDESPYVKSYLKDREQTTGKSQDNELYVDLEGDIKISEEDSKLKNKLTEEKYQELKDKYIQNENKIDLQTIEIIKNEIKEEADDAEDDLELITESDSGDYGVLSENDFETGEGFIENE